MTYTGTFTYREPGSDSNRDRVRFLFQETHSDNILIWDEDIDELLGMAGSTGDSTLRAAIMGAETIIAQAARLVTMRTGQVKIDYSNRIKQYKMLLERLRLRYQSSAAPYVSGITTTDREAIREDPERPSRAFSLDEMQNNGYV